VPRFVRLLGVVAAGVGIGVGLLWAFQRYLVYLPGGPVPPVADVLPGAEEVVFGTEDGLDLRAWFLPVEAATATVVVFPGNAGNRAGRAPLAIALAEHGLAVLLVDYRGYGGNPGRPDEVGLAADARAAIALLVARADVDANRVVYFGESLGSGVATGLALDVPPAALVLRSPFASLPAMAEATYRLPGIGRLVRDRYPTLQRIPTVGVPVLVVAGSADGVVPIDQSRSVYEAAAEPKRFLMVAGADHNDAELAWGPEVVAAVAAFIEVAVGD
jgi:uncharacterized protein